MQSMAAPTRRPDGDFLLGHLAGRVRLTLAVTAAGEPHYAPPVRGAG